MVRNILTVLTFTLISFSVSAEAYRISVEWNGLGDTTVLLAHYYDSKIYIDDSIQLNQNGIGSVSGDSLLPQGLYVLYLNEQNYFDFLLGEDQQFSLKTKQGDLIGNLEISGSEESEDFLKYQKHLKNQTLKKQELTKNFTELDQVKQEEVRKQLEQLDEEIMKYIQVEISQNEGSFYASFLRATLPFTIPDPPFDKSVARYDSLAFFYTYNYRKNHFLDGIDFTDDRLLYSPLMRSRLENYFSKLLIQHPDSVIPRALHYLKKAEPNKNMYQYLTQFLINNASQSKIMGMDALFVAVADEVYLKGKATWADSTTLRKIAEEAYLTRPNLIGKTAPELVMLDINDKPVSLSGLLAEFTILIFYEYDCGHCKKDIPKIYEEVWLPRIEHNIEVYAVCMNDDKAKWVDFVEKAEMEGWHHVWDPSHQSKFRFKYNTKAAPTIYLLNRDKKIVGKKLDATNLAKLIDALLKEK